MSYTPTNWKAGDTVTSAKLNKMEQGIVNNDSRAIIATWNNTRQGFVLNKTWKEIYDGNYSIIMIEDSNGGQAYEKLIGRILRIAYDTYQNLNLEYYIKVDQESYNETMIYFASDEMDYPFCYIGSTES